METEQQIPGAEAIPNDIPDSPHGDVSLAYSLQNFNALVAANTAMETELSSAAAREGQLQDQIAAAADEITHLREVIKEGLKPSIAALTKVTDDQERLIQQRDKTMAKNEADLAFAIEQRDVLQRRLDRALGYLDRTLDEEDGLRSNETRNLPAPKPPVGPDLGSVPDAVRRDGAGRNSMDYAYAARISEDVVTTRQRSY